MEKENFITIQELPEETLLTRQQVKSILKIGLSTLDTIIPYSELPRVRLGKHVRIARKDLEIYINKHRTNGEHYE